MHKHDYFHAFQGVAVTSETAQKTEAPPTGSFKTGGVALLAAVHFLHDIFTSYISPILPVLIEKLSLSLTQAGSLTLFIQMPSLANPFLGAFADRKRLTRWFVIVSPALTALFVSLIGLAPSYGMLAILLVAAGVSVAMLHVSAPVMVARLSGRQTGRGMGFFMVGGELARTIGPLAAVGSVAWLGLEGLWQLIPIGLIASAIVYWRVHDIPDPDKRKKPSVLAMLNAMRSIIAGVGGILIARAFMASSITTYLPTFLNRRGYDLETGALALGAFELAGVAGVYVSGTLSDKLGRRSVLLAAVLIAPGLLALVPFVDGVLLALVLLALGFFILATGPVLMAVMLDHSGANPAAANGTYMAISFAIRSLVVLAVGALSDSFGLQFAYLFSAAVALAGLPFIALIPNRIHN